jgi:hypothetical protein
MDRFLKMKSFGTFSIHIYAHLNHTKSLEEKLKPVTFVNFTIYRLAKQKGKEPESLEPEQESQNNGAPQH